MKRSQDSMKMEAYEFFRNYENQSITENGAVGYRTTLHPLLDLNFKVSSLRGRTKDTILQSFMKAFYDDRRHTVKWLFFLRDIKEGMGERSTFRDCLNYLAVSHPKTALAVMKLVPEYGRYDDLLAYFYSPLRTEFFAYIKEQLTLDQIAMKEQKQASLLAKWLPSINTSSKKARLQASKIAQYLKMSDREYRKCLASLRSYLDVVETKASANQWDQIQYEKVPAKANLKYDNAFARHDKERRAEYLSQVVLGDGKLNVGGLVPYEIVHRIMMHQKRLGGFQENLLAELMWKKMIELGFKNDWELDGCIVVADGSGSMSRRISEESSVTALDVCNSLALYFAEQLKGVFHNKAITFSATPQFIDLEKGTCLKEKLEIMLSHDEVSNTDIEAVFQMLLSMAISNQVPKDQLPKQVLIISDMEFDQAKESYGKRRYRHEQTESEEALFEQIARRYEKAGYAMPKLIFWNVCGQTDTIPTIHQKNGVCLLSGFSQNAMKTASQRDVKDPYESLLQTLDSPRYELVEQALQSVVDIEQS